MKKSEPMVLTISRQLGSGGAYIGHHLAAKLKFYYADREIVSRAARELEVLEEDLASRDEKTLSFWETFLQFNSYASEIYVPPIPEQRFFPTDLELFETEKRIIEKIAGRRSVIVMGRCGFDIFRGNPNHVSLFLHADRAFRIERIRKLYRVSDDEAARMMAQSDRDRASYIKTFTRKDWHDAGNYDLSVNTGRIGVDNALDLITDYLDML
jgi:cytidylate kinase